MDGLFGDGLVDVLCCGGDSLEEDLRWGPRLGALVDLVEFEDGVTNGGVALFKIVEALSGGAFFFSTSVELKTKGAGGGGMVKCLVFICLQGDQNVRWSLLIGFSALRTYLDSGLIGFFFGGRIFELAFLFFVFL